MNNKAELDRFGWPKFIFCRGPKKSVIEYYTLEGQFKPDTIENARHTLAIMMNTGFTCCLFSH